MESEEKTHAKWVICSDGYYPYCSNCHTEPDRSVEKLPEICPECGAVMDNEDLKILR